MDTAVIIKTSTGREGGGGGTGTASELAAILRGDGWRVIQRDGVMATDALALERPALIVIAVGTDADPLGQLETITQSLELEGVPIMALIDASQALAVARMRRVTDFIVRPVDAAEVRARARRPLIRQGRDAKERISVGTLTIDLKAYETRRGARTIDLTYQEFELMKFLASHPNQAFSRDQLLDRVWGRDYFGGARTVDIHVRRVRAKIGPEARCLKTVRAVGYKWVPSAMGHTETEQ